MTKKDLEILVCHGAVTVGMRINNCIKQYKSGIIVDNDGECGCSTVEAPNHAVTIVGFGE